jgi:hypothetical protein
MLVDVTEVFSLMSFSHVSVWIGTQRITDENPDMVANYPARGVAAIGSLIGKIGKK